MGIVSLSVSSVSGTTSVATGSQHGNENCECNEQTLMRLRNASINYLPITEAPASYTGCWAAVPMITGLWAISGTTEEQAAAIPFLISDEASYIHHRRDFALIEISVESFTASMQEKTR
jgi:hypothetical protein